MLEFACYLLTVVYTLLLCKWWRRKNGSNLLSSALEETHNLLESGEVDRKKSTFNKM